MDRRTRRFIEETLLTTSELSQLTGIPEVTLVKRYERDRSLAVLKGRTLLWDRDDFADAQIPPPAKPGEPDETVFKY